MKQFLTRAWWWLLGCIAFFTVFAFALNNRAVVTVHCFFGYESRIQLALLVLLVLMAGALLGAVAMLPLWWRQYHQNRLAAQLPVSANSANSANVPATATSITPPGAADAPARKAKSAAVSEEAIDAV